MRSKLLTGDSAKKNFIYQFGYQFVILVIPLIVSPYLTRTLGSRALGIYTYTYSIAYYFVIVAMLGISKHGQRIVAARKRDLLKLRRTVWSLTTLHIIVSIAVFVVYLLYALLLSRSERNVVLAQGIYVFSAVIDFTWLFQGLEKFKTVVIRNTIVKVLECICIFLFVKSPDDLVIYTIIMSLSTCIGFIIVLPQMISTIKPIKFTISDVMEHIKPMLVLFVAAVAATLYTIFNKTLLGILSDVTDVAFYEYSNKIITIPRTFIVVISTVLFPKACKMAASGKFNEMGKLLRQSLIVNYFIGFGSVFGLLAVDDLLAIEYYGSEFAICGDIISAMSPLILIIGLGEIMRSQFIYPLKMDKAMVWILFFNAGINLVLSSILIPRMGVFGAVIGTIVAEIFGLIIELYICRRYIKLRDFIRMGIPFLCTGIVMCVAIRLISPALPQNLSSLIIEIIVGAIIYIVISFLYCYFAIDEAKQIILSNVRKLKEKMVRK
ncbi:MAG TPA: flippase [Clostridiales bacterium]|nr:flippase [Clostridiales bacterium]